MALAGTSVELYEEVGRQLFPGQHGGEKGPAGRARDDGCAWLHSGATLQYGSKPPSRNVKSSFEVPGGAGRSLSVRQFSSQGLRRNA